MTATARPRPAARPPARPSPASEPAPEAAASTAARVEPTSTPPAADRPTMHALFVEAGGDTPAYDADRYVGLLRDHGWTRARVGLAEVVFRTVDRHRGAGNEATDYDAFARILADELGKEGYRIHDITRCVRVPDPLTVGRPMTPEEEEQLTIAGGSAAAARPRTPGPTFEHVTPEGDRFLVPEGWTPGEKSSRCRSCDALILWAVTPKAKRAPVNPDGTSHFSDCPDAPAWRKRGDS